MNLQAGMIDTFKKKVKIMKIFIKTIFSIILIMICSTIEQYYKLLFIAKMAGNQFETSDISYVIFDMLNKTNLPVMITFILLCVIWARDIKKLYNFIKK